VSGSDLFVANDTVTGSVGEYDATTAAPVNPALITGLSQPTGIAVSGSNLFVTNSTTGTIGEYTLAGTPVNAALVSGLSDPFGIAVSGSDLFVVNQVLDTISEYTTAGTPVNTSLISLGTGADPEFIEIVAAAPTGAPEPSTLALLGAGLAALAPTHPLIPTARCDYLCRSCARTDLPYARVGRRGCAGRAWRIFAAAADSAKLGASIGGRGEGGDVVRRYWFGQYGRGAGVSSVARASPAARTGSKTLF